MKITPIEIRQKEFQKAFRGYEKEEVDAFLLSLSQEWERVIEESKDLKRRLETAEKEVSRLRDVETSLFRTLKTAEDTGNNLIEQASKSAELHMKESHMNAEAILNDARFKAKSMVEDAEIEVRNLLDALQGDVKNIEREYQYLENQKENLFTEINNLMNDIAEKVERSSGKNNKEDFQSRLKNIKNYSLDKKNKISMEDKPEQSNGSPEIKTEVKNTAKPSSNENNPGSENKTEGKSFFDSI